MPSSTNQKIKILYLMKILLEKTDALNPMTMAEIISTLALYDIKAERKSLYSDIELLRHFGIDIEMQRNKTTGYYVAERQFELPELKLLVDAVQSSRSITEKKCLDLIKKLSSLTSVEQAKQLKRHVFVVDRVKSINKSIYYNIDQIHYAINEGKKITFKYFDFSINKKMIFRKQGNLYQATPVTLCWNNDNYYLITYSAKFNNYTHYRIDRMSNVNVLDEKGDAFDRNKFSIAKHVKRVFGMFDGEIVQAKLSFDNILVNAVIDHFGKDVPMISSEDGWFDIMVDVSISPVFLSWMFQFGEYAEILGPESLIEAMRELLDINNIKYFRD